MPLLAPLHWQVCECRHVKHAWPSSCPASLFICTGCLAASVLFLGARAAAPRQQPCPSWKQGHAARPHATMLSVQPAQATFSLLRTPGLRLRACAWPLHSLPATLLAPLFADLPSFHFSPAARCLHPARLLHRGPGGAGLCRRAQRILCAQGKATGSAGCVSAGPARGRTCPHPRLAHGACGPARNFENHPRLSYLPVSFPPALLLLFILSTLMRRTSPTAT